MSNTGREATETWNWLHHHIQPLLDTIDLRVEIASHSLSRVDLFSKGGDLRPIIPVYNDTGGRLKNFCTDEWKRRVVQRWLREQGYGPKRPVVEWLGISVDEVERAKDSNKDWATHHYPLLFDVQMSRKECIQLVQDTGLPTPPRSSCWMCPFRSDEEWVQLKNRPDGDWKSAIALDEEIRTRGRFGKLYLHRTCVPLDEVQWKGQVHEPSDVCDTGRCEY